MNNKRTGIQRISNVLFALFLIHSLILSPILARQVYAQAKKPVAVEDFGIFQRVSQQQISNDGSWVAYYQKPVKGDGTLFVIDLNSNIKYGIARGTQPTFSENSRWIAYTIIPHEKSDEELKAEKEAQKNSKEKSKPPKETNKLGILNLSSGQKTVVDSISSFKFSEDSNWLAYKLLKPEPDESEKEKEEEEKPEETGSKKDEKTLGTETFLRSLTNNSVVSFDEIDQYSFSENSEVFYYTVSSEDDTKDGIYYVDLSGNDRIKKVIASGKGRYKNLEWNEDGDVLLFSSDFDDRESENPALKLYSWKIKDDKAKLLFDPQIDSSFPQSMEVMETGSRWTKDGKSVVFLIAEKEKKEDESNSDSEDEKAKVDVWHWKDPVLQTQQKVRAERAKTSGQDTRQSYQAVYHIKDKSFVQLTDEKMKSIRLSSGDSRGIGIDRSQYEYENPWSFDSGKTRQGKSDYYLVNMEDGSRTIIEEGSEWTYQWSAGGDYLLQYIQPDWWVIDPAQRDNSRRNLTENVDSEFWNTDDDHPTIKRSWGMAGWSEDDEGVLLYDKYDIWYFPIAKKGAPVNLTAGMGRDINARFRYMKTDPDEEYIDVDKPVMLNYFDFRTKDSGYYEVKFGNDPVELVSLSSRLSGPRKAKDADVYMFTMSTFQDYGNIWVSDGSFRNNRQISYANSDNHGFSWGTSQLIDYTNSDGVKLQALLYLPEDYREGQKLPMIVYMYEKLTQNLHRYSLPATGSGFQISHFVSNGYAVLTPDIIYTDGFPGPSAVKCLVPATQKVVDMGIADPERIALTGHSWGGYQTAFTITQTDIYVCAYAGAPVANMTSAYGGIRWGTGNPRTFQYEETQSRIGGSLWEYPERYIANSPLFFVDKINTPLMILHGDADTAVPWYQSIEFFLALRRLNKPSWFLQYNGEPHGLRSETAKKDFSIRRMQFFDHFLKGKEMPLWMKEGVKYTNKGSIK